MDAFTARAGELMNEYRNRKRRKRRVNYFYNIFNIKIMPCNQLVLVVDNCSFIGLPFNLNNFFRDNFFSYWYFKIWWGKEKMKFRKKPVVVEAFQWFNNQPSVEGMEADLNSPSGFSCNTLEGKLNISSGDWIIKGIGGEFYPCKPEVFDKTYEPIDKSFKCAKCHNIIEHPSYQAPHLYCKECITKEGWISRYSALPGIGAKVETDGLAGKFIASLSLNGEYIEWRRMSDHKIVTGIKCWRNIQDKRPDFEKLKEGDLINIEYFHPKEGILIYSGYFYKFCGGMFVLSILHRKGHTESFYSGQVKKITRINLETKEFEEI